MQVDTIKIKADNAQGFKVINASDFDAKAHQAYDADARAAVKERNLADAEATEKLAAERKAQANFGQVAGSVVSGDGGAKNPSGTYSEPTPTDIRYPDKDATEFENNHGAYIKKSAADLRAEEGLPDAPGGIKPEEAKRVEAVTAAHAALAEPGAEVEVADKAETAPKAKK